MQRVPGKERRHQRAPPARTAQAFQKLKEKNGVGEMEEQIGQVVASGVEEEQRTIQHVGHPGDRMPVAGVGARQGPAHSFPSQSVLHHRIVCHVKMVVVVDELMVSDRPIDCGGQQEQEQTNVQIEAFSHKGDTAD